MLRSFSENPQDLSILNPELVRRELAEEYLLAIQRLKERPRHRSLKAVAFFAFGSLIPADGGYAKSLRFNPANPEILLSDADFTMIVERP